MRSLESRRPVRPALQRAAALALLLAVPLATPAVAAKVYRCGNAFQDQPCPEVKIAVATPVERTSPIARDTPCATRDAGGRTDCTPKAAAPRDVPTDARR